MHVYNSNLSSYPLNIIAIAGNIFKYLQNLQDMKGPVISLMKHECFGEFFLPYLYLATIPVILTKITDCIFLTF